MVDIEKINSNYTSIEKYLAFIEKYSFNSALEFEQDLEKYLSISMGLFTILNACIEIGEEIIDDFGFDYPQNYREIFLTLAKEKVISSDLAKSLATYMKHRNMLAHQYDSLEGEKIYDLFNDIAIFKEFIFDTKKFIKNS